MWNVVFQSEFAIEFRRMDDPVRDEILKRLILLERKGPGLARPYADTLKGSNFVNMKELRVAIGKDAWRIAYAFDPKRNALVLVAGNKAGQDQKLFYRRLIKLADKRFADHLERSE